MRSLRFANDIICTMNKCDIFIMVQYKMVKVLFMVVLS